MTLDEILKANEEAEKQREAQANAEEAQKELQGDVSGQNSEVSVAPIEKTPEQVLAEQAQSDLEAAFKARKIIVMQSVKSLIEQLIQDPNEFTVDELGWAVDAFKNALLIRTTATVQHEELFNVERAAENKFYSLKAKDLILVSNEVSTTQTETTA